MGVWLIRKKSSVLSSPQLLPSIQTVVPQHFNLLIQFFPPTLFTLYKISLTLPSDLTLLYPLLFISCLFIPMFWLFVRVNNNNNNNNDNNDPPPELWQNPRWATGTWWIHKDTFSHSVSSKLQLQSGLHTTLVLHMCRVLWLAHYMVLLLRCNVSLFVF